MKSSPRVLNVAALSNIQYKGRWGVNLVGSYAVLDTLLL